MTKDDKYLQALEKRNRAALEYVGDAISEHFADELELLEKESQGIEVPKDLHEKLQTLYRQQKEIEKKTFRRKRRLKIVRICACLCLAAVLTSGVLITSVEAFRERVYQIFVDDQDDHFSFRPVEVPYDTDGIIPPDWTGFYYPAVLPEGFNLVGADQIDTYTDFTFLNSENTVLNFSYNHIDEMNFLIDNSNDVEKIQIETGEAYLVYSGESTLLAWGAHEMFFVLISDIQSADIIEIANNITFFKK